MKRLLAILTLFSLLLCLAVVADRCSHRWQSNRFALGSDSVHQSKVDHHTIGIYGSGGFIAMQIGIISAPVSAQLTVQEGLQFGPPNVPLYQHDNFIAHMGFDAWLHQSPMNILGMTGRFYGLSVPSWFAAGVFAVLPGMWIRRWWRGRRAEQQGFPVTMCSVQPMSDGDTV